MKIMALTKSFNELVQRRVASDAAFGDALRHEGLAKMTGKKKPHRDATLDECLGEEDIPGVAMAEVVIGMLAGQLILEMRRKRLSKAALAKRMQTSPTQLDRVLMAKGNVTLETLQRAAALVGRELRLELV